MDAKERKIVIFFDLAQFMQKEAEKLNCDIWEVQSAIKQHLEYKGDKKWSLKKKK